MLMKATHEKPYRGIELESMGKLEQSLVSLPWDTQHFGVLVSRILPLELADSELRDVLSLAKAKGFELVYWTTPSDCNLSHDLLRQYSGLLVDKKVTFQKNLIHESTVDAGKSSSEMFEVVEYTQSQATEQLLSLAVKAGIHSRFNIDPNISEKQFEELYRIWMQRCTEHELAEVVFIAVEPSSKNHILGVITASVEQDIGRIGLICVSQTYQSMGVGSLLMNAVHRWMYAHDINVTTVVTQQGNDVACKFYAGLGYRLEVLQHIYHFWVQR